MSELDRYNYHKASKWYESILNMFKFDQSKDIYARDWMWSQRKDFDPLPNLKHIQNLCSNKILLFIGAGPSLHSNLERFSNIILLKRDNYFIIAADGATRGLLIFNIFPDLIVTDLDGLNPELIEKLVDLHILIVIHAHGDNIDKLKQIQAILSSEEKIIVTTQTEPKWPIINPGGFTDGDRALYFMHHIAPIKMPFYLVSYDFGELIGRYSKPEFTKDMPMTPMKQKKNDLAQKLIENLRVNENRQIESYLFNLND